MTDARTTNTTADEQFDIVLRGYERKQVDDHVGRLNSDRLAGAQRINALERRVEELHFELQNAQKQSAEAEPTLANFGDRLAKILRLVEEEASEYRAEAKAGAEKDRKAAEASASQVRAQADEDARARREQTRQEAAKLLEEARKEAAQVRAEAANEAAAKRDEAEGILEAARAKAAQAAAEFEASLAKRRDQAERDLAVRQEAAERHLKETSDQAEQLRVEAQKMREEAERRSRQMLETAQREAEDIVAEARAKAERSRLEAERELAALTHRRDSINAQLSNVREMLATLTGAAVPGVGGVDPAKVVAAAKAELPRGGAAAATADVEVPKQAAPPAKTAPGSR